MHSPQYIRPNLSYAHQNQQNAQTASICLTAISSCSDQSHLWGINLRRDRSMPSLKGCGPKPLELFSSPSAALSGRLAPLRAMDARSSSDVDSGIPSASADSASAQSNHQTVTIWPRQRVYPARFYSAHCLSCQRYADIQCIPCMLL